MLAGILSPLCYSQGICCILCLFLWVFGMCLCACVYVLISDLTLESLEVGQNINLLNTNVPANTNPGSRNRNEQF